MAKSLSLARSSLVLEVQESIKELIFEQELKPGDSLPTEHELAEKLGVSRNSLREALKVLEATGIVVIRRGFGMFVGEMSLQALVSELVFHARLSALNGTKELRDLVDLRETLESSLVRRVASQLSPRDLEKIGEALAAMEAAADAGAFSPESDKLFHEALYQPLDNPFISQLLSAFWVILSLLEEHLPASSESAKAVAAQHRAIYSAFAEADADAAERAMVLHFSGIKARLDAVAPLTEAAPVAR